MPRKAAASSHTTLGPGGRAYWDSVTTDYELDDTQKLLLLEACRCKDRLDKLDAILRGDSHTWMEIELPRREHDNELLPIVIDKAAATAAATQNMIKQLVATLRLADTRAGRPHRGGNPGSARGTYNKGTTSKPSAVSSLDRARERAERA